VSSKNDIRETGQIVTLALAEICLVVFRISSHKEDGKVFVSKDVYDPTPSALPDTAASDSELSEAAGTLDEVAAVWICCHGGDDFHPFCFREDCFCCSEIRRYFDDCVHNDMYSIGHLTVNAQSVA
jgi:hypothetical protein